MKIWYGVSTFNFYNHMNVSIAACIEIVKIDKLNRYEFSNAAVTLRRVYNEEKTLLLR